MYDCPQIQLYLRDASGFFSMASTKRPDKRCEPVPLHKYRTRVCSGPRRSLGHGASGLINAGATGPEATSSALYRTEPRVASHETSHSTAPKFRSELNRVARKSQEWHATEENYAKELPRGDHASSTMPILPKIENLPCTQRTRGDDRSY